MKTHCGKCGYASEHTETGDCLCCLLRLDVRQRFSHAIQGSAFCLTVAQNAIEYGACDALVFQAVAAAAMEQAATYLRAASHPSEC